MSTSEPTLDFHDAQDAWEAEVRRPIRKLVRLTVVLLVLIGLVAFFVCEDRISIDRNSGRLRIDRAIGPLILSDSMMETGFSRTAAPGELGSENWRVIRQVRFLSSRMAETPPGVPAKLQAIETLWNERGIFGDERKALARKVLAMLKADRDAEIEAFLVELRRTPPDRN